MDKKSKTLIIFFAITIPIILVSWIGINILDGNSHYDSSLCTICHQSKRLEGKTYCYSCFLKAEQKVEEKNSGMVSSNPNTSNTNTSSISLNPDPKKTSSNSQTTSPSSKTTNSNSKPASSYSKTTSSSSSKKVYNSLNYDPDDYDDPDEYADDAWDEDFDDYDDAYDFWEDY